MQICICSPWLALGLLSRAFSNSGRQDAPLSLLLPASACLRYFVFMLLEHISSVSLSSSRVNLHRLNQGTTRAQLHHCAGVCHGPEEKAVSRSVSAGSGEAQTPGKRSCRSALPHPGPHWDKHADSAADHQWAPATLDAQALRQQLEPCKAQWVRCRNGLSCRDLLVLTS